MNNNKQVLNLLTSKPENAVGVNKDSKFDASSNQNSPSKHFSHGVAIDNTQQQAESSSRLEQTPPRYSIVVLVQRA